MADVIAELEAEYCPPLDPALLSAIASDYDLTSETALRCAKEALAQLRDSALFEEHADFDPSGTSTWDDVSDSKKPAESSLDVDGSTSRETELSSLSNGISSINLDTSRDVEDEQTSDYYEKLDEGAKLKKLQEVFKDQVNTFTIKYTLRKCNGRWNTAFEELLNLAYLGDDVDGSNSNARGIDAFSEDNIVRRKRTGKNKKSRPDRHVVLSESSSPLLIPADRVGTNRWKSAQTDIDFIVSRTKVGKNVVASSYHENGGNLPKTIRAMIRSTGLSFREADSEERAIAENSAQLQREFPAIPMNDAIALIRLTHPSTAAAHEMAKTLTISPAIQSVGGVQIVPLYEAPPGLDLEEAGASAKAKYSSASSALQYHDTGTDAAYREAYTLAKAAAFSKASAAHRRARSDRLMGGAAAYYGEVGREYAALSARAAATNADSIAAAQSSRTQLDLHGIDVQNATRIASGKVNAWWEGLGEARVNGRLGADDRAAGYKIIVGLGRHSEGGKGKLGPAVSRALREEGWKVESVGGALMVMGPRKR